MKDATAEELAAALADAHATASSITPDTLPSVDSTADAYRVQERLVDRVRDRRGEPVGYKIGFTNERVRRDLSVDEPGYGRVLDGTVRSSPATVDAEEFVDPRIEPEIAFRLGSDLPADASRDRVRDAVTAVVPAIEVVDSRTGWEFDAPLAVADNCLDAGLVLGEGIDPADLALADEAVTLRVDGDPVDSGVGTDVFGHPLAALAWLADAVDGLPAGTLVTTGSLTEPVPVAPGETAVATFASLGSVDLRVR
ncbi:2-keto-4-pentenoate hydratase [Halobaculum magnesiiphilum]|uniref:Fumarylacetoacetate hydrolase family protein n=1 Tax=Halobaculum magnesiiphilum TaxID=1017351 RepID=A0A8T8WFB7_9EURY|nr:fumarylacetoacetate hydrolase family protein [Halobaculum magnesiiphilum]QZP38549.1 fumarylacetoacetate hydrolase family protein [Halobaculum magnesiiphilum]